MQVNRFTKQKPTQTHREKTEKNYAYYTGRVGKGVVRECGTDVYTLLYLKWITNRDLLYKKETVKVKVTQSCQTFCDPRQEYQSGQPFPSPGDLPNPGIKPRSPALQVDKKGSSVLCNILNGKIIKKKKYYVTESLCCAPETMTVFLIKCTLI